MMKSYIHHIEPVAPAHSYRQDYARDRMTGWLPGRRNRRLIHNIYDHSGIETRHSVLPDFDTRNEPVLFREDEEGRIIEPMTGERNRCFRSYAPGLVVEAGKRALEHSEGFAANDITHVITVSCTGFYNPGPDLELIHGLGLKESTERYNIGFMGCYAAFPALRMADQFCKANPDSVVMVVCIELCTLHLQFNEKTDSMLANALFADGAAAVLVSSRTPASGRPAMAIDAFGSALSPEGEKEMAWEVGNRGFDIRLSSYVPDIIAANIGAIVDRLLREAGRSLQEIETWAVHPGGRAILDRVAEALQLAPRQLEDSRDVLRKYGNMSSVTVLYVLHRILHRQERTSKHRICAMAFGPGLTIESALLEYLPSKTGAAPRAGSAVESPT
jgi:predicted naringenin-chalcone synthase